MEIYSAEHSTKNFKIYINACFVLIKVVSELQPLNCAEQCRVWLLLARLQLANTMRSKRVVWITLLIIPRKTMWPRSKRYSPKVGKILSKWRIAKRTKYKNCVFLYFFCAFLYLLFDKH